MDRKRKLGAFVLFNNLLQSSRKRQKKEMDDFDNLYDSLKEPDDVDDVEDGDIMGTIAHGTALATMSNKRCGPRGKPINRDQQKELWSSGYLAGNWDENAFKARLRVTKDTFEFILNEISPLIRKVPTSHHDDSQTRKNDVNKPHS